MFDKPIESVMSDAWGRRIARDWPSMPSGMHLLFHVTWVLYKVRWHLSLFCMFGFYALAGIVLTDTYSPYGMGGLMSDHSLLVPAFVIAAMAPIVWLLPATSAFVVNTWYYRARKQF